MLPVILSVSLLADLSRPVSFAEALQPPPEAGSFAELCGMVRGHVLASRVRKGMGRLEAERMLGVPTKRFQFVWCNRKVADSYPGLWLYMTYEDMPIPVAGEKERQPHDVVWLITPARPERWREWLAAAVGRPMPLP